MSLILMMALIDRLRHGRARAEDVAALRRRFAEQPGRAQVSEEEVAAADELRALRAQLSAAIGAVASCRSCARGHPLPHGRWEGGHCCGAETVDLFNDDEVAALRLAGTKAGRLRLPVLPDRVHAGCSFRGPRGCGLAAVDRPNLCVRYLCPDLTRELHARGDLAEIEALGTRMEAVYLRFIKARAARLDREELGEP
jgi:hypothetical protein